MRSAATPVPDRAANREASDAATVNAIAWQPRRGMDLAEWLHQGKRLGAIGRGAAWWIGDWVNYGNTKFGEKYTRAARITGYDSQSLMNMAYVASRVDVRRRREELSWSHHAEVAALSPDEQERWLVEAEQEGLSVHRLRERLRAVRAGASIHDSDDPHEEANAAEESGADVAALGLEAHNSNSVPASNGVQTQHRNTDFPVDDDSKIVCPRCGFEMGDGHG